MKKKCDLEKTKSKTTEYEEGSINQTIIRVRHMPYKFNITVLTKFFIDKWWLRTTVRVAGQKKDHLLGGAVQVQLLKTNTAIFNPGGTRMNVVNGPPFILWHIPLAIDEQAIELGA